MSKFSKAKPRLGRGLSSLISVSDIADDVGAEGDAPPRPAASDGGPSNPALADLLPRGPIVIELPVEQIRPNPHQPRRQFNEASIAELAASLKSTGLVQPIIVRRADDGGYELIAGERRLRAAKQAKLETLPALVKEVDGFSQAQMALVENIQREDLNAIDRANAYHILMTQLGLTVSELAGRLGEERSSISNYLRLLDLSEPVRELVRSGELSMGHGKLLAGIPDPQEQLKKAKVVISQGLSVRNLERIISSGSVAKASEKGSKGKGSAHIAALEKTLSHQLGTRVQIKASSQTGKGKLILHYTSLDQFDNMMGRLGVVIEE
jgi:ParB family transcriptional regulator, chromosome partitioning protein